MSLTGTTFQVTMIALVLLAVVGTLVLWSKARGPHWAKAIQRLAMLVLCQALAIGLAGTWVNNSFGLYASWGELLGINRQGRLVMVGPPPQRAEFTRAPWGMEGTYFRGRTSGLASQVYVWLPPQYHQPAYRHTAFPVLMLLHGVPGEPESWMTGGGMPGRLASAISGGTLHPVILVVPSVDPGGVDTDCSNTRRAHVATWLARDVPALIRHHFRVEPGPDAWALAGLSTGGLCALKLPMEYPNVFGAGAGMSPDPVTGDPSVLSNPMVRRANSPLQLARRRPPVHLWAGTGMMDRNSTAANIHRLREVIRRPTSLAPAVLIPGGGHTPDTWAQLEPPMFAWLNTVLAPPRQIPRR